MRFARMDTLRCVVLIQLVSTTLAGAGDVYLVQFDVLGKQQGFYQVAWRDEVLFYNPGTVAATVRVLGISNGTLSPHAQESLSLPPRTVVSFWSMHLSWVPSGPTAGDPDPFWVLHLDVPDSVLVESRNEFWRLRYSLGGQPGPTILPGRVSMPVFRRLTPAGEPQVILGTDLGDTQTRINVGVYNAGANSATAIIEVRRACDNSVADSRSVVIPANTFIQIGPLNEGEDTCGIDGRPIWRWVRYTVVTVDQPSLSYVANVAETAPFQCDGVQVTPLVTIAVAAPQRP